MPEGFVAQGQGLRSSIVVQLCEQYASDAVNQTHSEDFEIQDPNDCFITVVEGIWSSIRESV